MELLRIKNLGAMIHSFGSKIKRRPFVEDASPGTGYASALQR